MEFDISKLGFSFVAGFTKKSDAVAAAKGAGFGVPHRVYTRFCTCWVVGEHQAGDKYVPAHLVVLTKDGQHCSCVVSETTDCLGKPGQRLSI
jgi:hypothetical protein